MTLRSLYYRCVSAGLFPAGNPGYNALLRIMRILREDGTIPLVGWLVDNTRSRIVPSVWRNVGARLNGLARNYRRSYWYDQPNRVEIFVEKDAIAGTLEDLCDELQVPLIPVRGDVSVSAAGETAGVWREAGKPIHAFYLGDWDPAGLVLERVLRDKLARYSGRTLNWIRLGILEIDFADFGLLELPLRELRPGAVEARRAAFVARYGERCAEIDALPPDELRRRVRAAVESLIDRAVWNRSLEQEADDEAELERLVDGWTDRPSTT